MRYYHIMQLALPVANYSCCTRGMHVAVQARVHLLSQMRSTITLSLDTGIKSPCGGGQERSTYITGMNQITKM